MSDTNCHCCMCQYSTPPWWVTMGFTPPNNYGQILVAPSASPATGAANPGAIPGTNSGGGAKPQPPKPGSFGSAVGGVLGNTGAAVGNAVGTVLTTPVDVAGAVIGNVASTIGNVLGSIF